MEIVIIMRKSHLKKKHHDFALEWYDDEKAYWLCNDTDNWKTEECSFDWQNGSLTISLVNGDGLFVSIVVPFVDVALAASKVDLAAVVDRNIAQLMDAQKGFLALVEMMQERKE